MPFGSIVEVERRLVDPAPLTAEEVKDFIGFYQVIGTGGMRRLTSELALQEIAVIQKFDQSSRTLSRVLIWLTIGLFLLTAILTYQALAPKV